MNITFDVKNQIISRTDTNRVVADSKNYLYAEFKFTSDWNGTKTAIFSNDNVETTYEQLLIDDKCLVPAEVLKAGTLCVSAFCGDLVTANKAYLVVEESGLKDGETPQPPTPDIYTQILEKAEYAETVASEIQGKAESGAFNGKAATVDVGEVITGESNTPVAITNSGTQNAAVLNFTIPKGDKGDKGDTGTQGEPGKDGAAATVTVGTVTTGDPDTPASVTNSGTPNAAVLDFVIPQGEKGDSAFTSIKPGTQEEPYIIQKYGYYCTTGVGWVQVRAQGQEASVISELDFYKPFYCATDTLIIFGMSNEYNDVNRAFTYIISIGDDIKVSVSPVSGSDKEPFNYSLNEIFQNFLAIVSILQPIIEEGRNAVNKIVVVDSFDSSHGFVTFSVRDADSELSDESTFPVQNKVVTAALAQKKAVPAISTPSSSSITLENNSEYRLQATASLNLALPESIPDDYECSLVFESGATATVLSYPADVVEFIGDDCDSEGDFIPAADKGYEISIKNLGFDRIVARVGAF